MLHLLSYAHYLGDFITLANLWEKAKNDKVPGFSPSQFQQLLDVVYKDVPKEVAAFAKEENVLALFKAGQALLLKLMPLKTEFEQVVSTFSTLVAKR